MPSRRRFQYIFIKPEGVGIPMRVLKTYAQKETKFKSEDTSQYSEKAPAMVVIIESPEASSNVRKILDPSWGWRFKD